ncbi:MAG: hypothetical protein Q7S05_02375 [bacterium]|nr:hypothetical protein [bacterium]
MTKNPYVNALLASGYITLVSSALYWGPQYIGRIDSVFAPIAFLSLFVLSAAVMGFLFFFQPIQMYLEAEKKEAVNLFLKTLAVFAGITAALISILVVLSLQ